MGPLPRALAAWKAREQQPEFGGETSLTTTLAQTDSSPTSLKADPLARMDASRWRSAFWLAALGVLALFPTLLSPFFADDYFHIEHAAQLRAALTHGWVLDVDSAGAWWTPPGLSVEYFRPLVVLSFAADRLFYGDHAFGYHVTNLLLHLTTTLLLWGIARRVLGAGFAAWAAAALFAIHPAHTVAIGWISGRTDVLATMFYAAAFLLYLQSRPLRASTAPWLALSCVAFSLALLAKEMAITLPAVILAHNLLVPRGESLVRRLVAPLVIGAVGASYLALRISTLGGFHAPPAPFAYHLGDPGLVMHLVTAPLLYLADLVLFVPADPMATLPFWHEHPWLLVVFVGFVLFVFAGTLKKASSRVTATWAFAWMGITVLPVLMLTVGEHFLYLPSMGYCVLVASQLPSSPGSVEGPQRRSLAIVAALVTLVCFGRSAMFYGFSRSASRSIDETVAAIDAAPLATHILVADLAASAALAFPHAVRLARPERPLDVEILSLVPRVMPGVDDLSTVTFTAPDHLELQRASGYLNSYLERALQGPPTPFHQGQTFERGAYAVTVRDAPEGRIHAFDIRLADPEHTLVLSRQNGNLEPLRPIYPH
jgi:hypothetical protein